MKTLLIPIPIRKLPFLDCDAHLRTELGVLSEVS